MQRIVSRLPRPLSRRAILPRPSRHTYSSQPPFGAAPSPPRLPKEDQEIFEKLQRQSTGAFSTPHAPPQVNQSPDSSPTSTSPSPSASTASPARMQINQSPHSSPSSEQQPEIRIEGGAQIREGEDLHPNMRRGAPPEFEGDVNPKTGEVGGPKNEPLRWGYGGDWSYNGRVTDF